MTYVIVNADDFGASRGINRAILELHEGGVVTSASLMVQMPATDDAIDRASRAPHLGVGLHVALTHEDGTPKIDFDDAERCADAIQRQVNSFIEKVDRVPTHIDAHQNVHRDPRLAPLFQETALRYGLPLREHSAVRYFSRFYGQWDGVPHPEHIGIESLLHMLAPELDGGILELSCHPGYLTEDFTSSYGIEREIERRTLSDKRLSEFFRRNGVALVRFSDEPVVAAMRCAR